MTGAKEYAVARSSKNESTPLIKAILSNCARVYYVFVGQHVLFFCSPRCRLFVFCACRKIGGECWHRLHKIVFSINMLEPSRFRTAACIAQLSLEISVDRMRLWYSIWYYTNFSSISFYQNDSLYRFQTYLSKKYWINIQELIAYSQYILTHTWLSCLADKIIRSQWSTLLKIYTNTPHIIQMTMLSGIFLLYVFVFVTQNSSINFATNTYIWVAFFLRDHTNRNPQIALSSFK